MFVADCTTPTNFSLVEEGNENEISISLIVFT
jgi:hypothetical protein